ncbi:type II toxin-antitoxin system RelE/ParE family toxin [uncultured Christiangramia sp.]|uniref:type II toxin-antitoxin system RelE/ParE family toxin n=1 Tax=uncultured Christiangramia sp. TaxID=503836 RepID=UPI0026329371|nr:type II toxin-antitoxin system RelE/ParE family toxin [uncultured Christiangramia sp.]
MSNCKLSNVAKEDLIRIHQFGIKRLGVIQADKYFERFFEYFDTIAEKTFAFESIDFIKPGYRRYVSGSDSTYYRVFKNSVEIISIIGRQDLSNI